jgi:Ca2+-binding RTX toxin-like protein
VTGSAGNDTIDCGGTNPPKTINGNGGNDTITGTDFDDTINGGDADDTITGGTGAYTINGGLGIDKLSGSAGNDILVGASNDGSQDTVAGGDGFDTCQGPAPDPDIHTGGGAFTLTVNPAGYTCVFPSVTGHRVPEATTISAPGAVGRSSGRC